jgi:hypothetical protein
MRILRVASLAVVAALAAACGGAVYSGSGGPDDCSYSYGFECRQQSSDTVDTSESSDTFESSDWTVESTDWTDTEWTDSGSSDWSVDSTDWTDSGSSDWSDTEWTDSGSSDWSDSEWSDTFIDTTDSSDTTDWSNSEWSDSSDTWFGSSEGTCVQFTLSPTTQVCASDADCTWVLDGEVCTGECACPSYPSNQTTWASQQSLLASLGPAPFCGCPVPANGPHCISHQCTF